MSNSSALPLAIILLCYIVLAGVYAAHTPIFESPDESSHLQVIRYIGETRTLPPYQIPDRRADTGPNMAWLISYHNPPLYYAPPLYHTLGAALTFWTSMDDLPDRLIPNPSWGEGWSPQRGTDPWNKNVFVHLPTETWQESPTVRAAAILRGFSIVLGAITILAAYGLAWDTGAGMPDRHRRCLALGATLWVALNPQFIASSTGVSNDPLTIAIFSVAMLAMVRWTRTAASWPRWVVLGALVGLGALTKQSALMLCPLGGLAALFGPAGEGAGKNAGARARARAPEATQRFWPTGAERAHRFSRAVAFSLSAGIIASPWYVSNLIRYGDLLGTNPHYAIQVSLAGFGWDALWATLQSYWGAFGWALITLPWPVYASAGSAVLLAVAGMIRSLFPHGAGWPLTRHRAFALALTATALLMNFLALTRWAVATGAPYGRLLFPTVTATGVLLAWGWLQWRGKLGRWLLTTLIVLNTAGAIAAPWVSLPPAFASPYLGQAPTPSMQSITCEAAANVQPIAYHVSEEALRRGERFAVTLAWQATAAPSQQLSVWAQLSGPDPTERVAGQTRWLGGTRYPNILWRPDDVVAQEITLEIPDWTPAPAIYWLRFGLTGEDGELVGFGPGKPYATLGPWRIRQDVRIPAQAQKLDVRLGEHIRLRGYAVKPASDKLHVQLYWYASGNPAQDATVFVHLIDAEGNLLAQHDGIPNEGRYPTSWWLKGDIVPDPHILVLDEERGSGAALVIGMYNPATGIRLPVHTPDGERIPHDAITLPLGADTPSYP